MCVCNLCTLHTFYYMRPLIANQTMTIDQSNASTKETGDGGTHMSRKRQTQSCTSHSNAHVIIQYARNTMSIASVQFVGNRGIYSLRVVYYSVAIILLVAVGFFLSALCFFSFLLCTYLCCLLSQKFIELKAMRYTNAG